MADILVLDTSLLLGGKEPPPGTWVTTPEAEAEVSPGGRDARRFDFWRESGMTVRAATADARRRVETTARHAGSLGRLSPADQSLIALALETGGTLVTDDHTMLDIARRLEVTTQTIATKGISGTMDWRPRCSGCGRWFDDMPRGEECTVCGSPVRLKPSNRGP